MSRRKSSAAGRRPASRSPASAADAAAATSVWLFGRHTVLAAAGNPRRRILRLLALPEAAAELIAATGRRGHGPPVETVEKANFAALLPPGAVHQGMAALAHPLPDAALEDLLVPAEAPAKGRVVVVLDQIEDPRNVGAVLRSAAAFGASALIAQNRHAPAATPLLAKVASGALEVVPLIQVVNIARTLDRLQEAGFVCLGLDSNAEKPLASAVPPGGDVAFVLGSEGRGLRRLVRDGCDALVGIPISDAVESLNVAVAAAIALYEWRRCRDLPEV